MPQDDRGLAVGACFLTVWVKGASAPVRAARNIPPLDPYALTPAGEHPETEQCPGLRGIAKFLSLSWFTHPEPGRGLLWPPD
jgi:hypothetical protein